MLMDFVVQNVSDESSIVSGQTSVAMELFGWRYFGEVRPQECAILSSPHRPPRMEVERLLDLVRGLTPPLQLVKVQSLSLAEHVLVAVDVLES